MSRNKKERFRKGKKFFPRGIEPFGKKEEKNARVTFDSKGNATLTKRGVLLYWWAWHHAIKNTGLDEFEALIDTYGVEKILNVFTFTHIVSDGSVNLIKVAIANNDVKNFVDAINEDVGRMNESDKASYDEIKLSCIAAIRARFKMDLEQSGNNGILGFEVPQISK